MLKHFFRTFPKCWLAGIVLAVEGRKIQFLKSTLPVNDSAHEGRNPGHGRFRIQHFSHIARKTQRSSRGFVQLKHAERFSVIADCCRIQIGFGASYGFEQSYGDLRGVRLKQDIKPAGHRFLTKTIRSSVPTSQVRAVRDFRFLPRGPTWYRYPRIPAIEESLLQRYFEQPLEPVGQL